MTGRAIFVANLLLVVLLVFYVPETLGDIRKNMYTVHDRDIELVDRDVATETDIDSYPASGRPYVTESTPTLFASGPQFSGGSVFDMDPDHLFNINFSFGDIFEHPKIFHTALHGFGRKRWWQGENVCVEKSETVEDDDSEGKVDETSPADDNGNNGDKVESGKESKKDADNKEISTEGTDENTSDDLIYTGFQSSFNMNVCQETLNEYICKQKERKGRKTKTSIQKYQCCFGAQRADNDRGCEKIDLKPLTDTIKDLKASEFLKLYENVNSTSKHLNSNENLTIFVPDDVAFNKFTEKMLEMNKLDYSVELLRKRKRRDIENAVSSQQLILNHVVKGLHTIGDTVDTSSLKSLFNDNEIRLDTCPVHYYTVATANCVPILKRNIYAKNGVIHKIDGVMTPIMHSIEQILSTNPRVSEFKTILEKNNLLNFFTANEKHTVFIPTNEALKKLQPDVRDNLMNGGSCALNFLRNHVMKKELCACALNGRDVNAKGNQLRFNVDRENDTIAINGKAKIIERNILATNGIIHVVDDILYPETLMSLEKVLNEQEDINEFAKLLKEPGLGRDLNSLRNVTIFVPTDKALKEFDGDLNRELLEGHVVTGSIKPCQLDNEDVLTTQSGQKLRFTRSGLSLYSVNCARIQTRNSVQSCGSNVYRVDKVLKAPKKTIAETLEERKDEFGMFTQIIEGTEVAKLIADPEKSFTLLVMPDSVLNATIDEEDLQGLLESKKRAEQWASKFVLKGSICCSNVGFELLNFDIAKSLANQYLKLTRHGHKSVDFGNYRTTECDIMATNGLIHTIKWVPQHRFKLPFEMLHGLFFI